jgi:hypothetical protein
MEPLKTPSSVFLEIGGSYGAGETLAIFDQLRRSFRFLERVMAERDPCHRNISSRGELIGTEQVI